MGSSRSRSPFETPLAVTVRPALLADQIRPLLTDTIDGLPTVNPGAIVTLTQPIPPFPLLPPPFGDDVFWIVRRTVSEDPPTMVCGLAVTVQVSAAATGPARARRRTIAPAIVRTKREPVVARGRPATSGDLGVRRPEPGRTRLGAGQGRVVGGPDPFDEDGDQPLLELRPSGVLQARQRLAKVERLCGRGGSWSSR